MDFDIQDFLLHYPQFITLSDETINMLWITQKLIGKKVVNIAITMCQKFEIVETYKNWSYLVLAHLCKMQQNKIVGRISNAAEGGITSALSMYSDKSSDFWNQTIYGTQCLQLLKTRPTFKYFY